MNHWKHLSATLLIAAIVLAGGCASNQSMPTASTHKVAVPEAIAQALRDYDEAVESNDLARAADFRSQRYLHNGEDYNDRRAFLAKMISQISEHQIIVTRFEQHSANEAKFDGYTIHNFGRTPIADMRMVLEDGRWRLLGNQR